MRYWLKTYGWVYVPVGAWCTFQSWVHSGPNGGFTAWSLPEHVIYWAVALGLATAFILHYFYLNDDRPWPWDFEGWRRWKRWHAGLCMKCGYNLKGNVSGSCPECGEPADRDSSD